ncbi:LytR C-terminal domain-containing protein [Candidatus Kaiserbacteria bacterium]|nr:LytR C-terminal domain-containing protein [Candidatus Kaiserbacteria bacterium]
MVYIKTKQIMMLILKNNKILSILLIVYLAVFLLLPTVASAQSAITLSVTPTLFQMSADPGQVWKSSVKVVNSNNFDLTVYAKPVNFQPQGEGGTGKFLPIFENFTEGSTLAEWIDINQDAVTIPAFTSQEIPFIVSVPDNAAPGGHFAAILISTQPPKPEKNQVVTTQVVTSLFFLRLSGDVIESGSIREFRVNKRFVSNPVADFEFRFENDGNVHIQPQGDITIYNMWGEKRGIVPINQQTHFGNVLPNSIRQFNFSWAGELALTEIGLHRAELTLGYGENGKHYVTRRVYFWVIPIKEVFITLGVLALIALLVVWAVKSYIRRMLHLAGIDPIKHKKQPRQYISRDDTTTVRIHSVKQVSAPVRIGITDLKRRLIATETGLGYLRTLFGFVISYRKFFIGIILILLALSTIVWFIKNANIEDRNYEVTVEGVDNSITITSEEMIYDDYEQSDNQVTQDITLEAPANVPKISIINTSGIPGTAATLRKQLETAGYTVEKISSELNRHDERTIVVFTTEFQDVAVALSERLNDALLSGVSTSTTGSDITIFVGSDMVTN